MKKFKIDSNKVIKTEPKMIKEGFDVSILVIFLILLLFFVLIQI